MMTDNSLKKLNSGCARKVLFVFLWVVSSAGIGWSIGRVWTERGQPVEAAKPVFTSDHPTAPVSANQQEWQKRATIRARRSQLGIESQFFRTLVDEVLDRRYPDLAKDSSEKRAKRGEISLELLDRLETLDETIRRDLGKFDRQQHQQWRESINDLRLSSRVLNILADRAFFAVFPEVTDRPDFDRPLGQVWSAFALGELQSLQSGASYREITTLLEGGVETIDASVQEKKGNAYAIEARSNHTLTLTLETPEEVEISLYSPSGNVTLLENSNDRQWSGKLPEDGFYELVIVSKSTSPTSFRLDLQIANP
jgi:hypothetical protein